jgi:hypothetical protein
LNTLLENNIGNKNDLDRDGRNERRQIDSINSRSFNTLGTHEPGEGCSSPGYKMTGKPPFVNPAST